MKYTERGRLLAAAAALAGIAFTGPAPATETLKLTFLSGYPPLASWTGAAMETFIPQIDAALAKTGNYKVEWNLAH